MRDLLRLIGGDLAGVISGVALLGQGDDQFVAVVLLLQSHSVALVDDLVGDGDDVLALLPQEDKPL